MVEVQAPPAGAWCRGIFLLLLYALDRSISEFLAPYNLHTRNIDFIYAPPQRVHLFHDGQLRRAVRLRPQT